MRQAIERLHGLFGWRSESKLGVCIYIYNIYICSGICIYIYMYIYVLIVFKVQIEYTGNPRTVANPSHKD